LEVFYLVDFAIEAKQVGIIDLHVTIDAVRKV